MTDTENAPVANVVDLAASECTEPKIDTAENEQPKTEFDSFMTESLKKLDLATNVLHLSESYKKNLLLLKDLQIEHLNIEEQYRKEWNEMKLKYLTRFRTLYEKRKSILTTTPTTDQTISETGPVQSGTKGLPGFWLTVFSNNSTLCQMIEEHDRPVLNYLEDIAFSWVDPKEQTSFRLEFFFAPNEFFSNEVLSKTYCLERAGDSEDNVLTKTIGTEINWFPDKDVTQKILSRCQRNKYTNQTRKIYRKIDANSFFNYFRTNEIPPEEHLDTMGESEVNSLEMLVEAEFEVGSVIRDKIIPRAVGWFLNVEHDDDASSIEEMEPYSSDEDDDDEDEDEE